jgi:hypothetical protein
VDAGRSWLPPEEGFPSCSSGMAQEERLEEYSVPGKSWTVTGIGRRRNKDDPLCKRVPAQKKKTGVRDKLRMLMEKEPRKQEQTRRGVVSARNATVA